MTEIYEGDKKVGVFCGGIGDKELHPEVAELEKLMKEIDEEMQEKKSKDKILKSRYESKEE